MEKMSSLSQLIASWFKEYRRDLPWRSSPKDPYRVWISEVMLQQTRVEVVIPYFERFMLQFPTLESLAEANDEILLKSWEGLGYYSRVRSLKKAAALLIASGQTTLPNQLEELLKLPGIGPYTAGAILSFAFQKRGIAIDGNVKRVMSRLFAINYPLDSKELWNRVKRHLEEDLLLGEESHVLMEGLIELGALVCTPAPKCALCPVASHCIALSEGRQLELPIAKKRAESTLITTPVAVVICEDVQGEEVFLIRPPKETGLFKGLALFPSEKELFGEKRFSINGEPRLGSKDESFELQTSLEEIVQTYTRYKETLRPAIYKALSLEEREGLMWLTKEQLETLSMPAGHRKLRKMTFAFLERSKLCN